MKVYIYYRLSIFGGTDANSNKTRKQTQNEKRVNIVYPGSHERKFSSLNPASPGPTRSNFLSFAGGVFMTRSGYWGVRTSIFGRSNLATVPRGGFSNGQIFSSFRFLVTEFRFWRYFFMWLSRWIFFHLGLLSKWKFNIVPMQSRAVVTGGVRTSIFGRSNLATVPRGGFSNGQIFLHFAFL